MYSKDILTAVLEKFHEIPFTRQAMQRVHKIRVRGIARDRCDFGNWTRA